MMKLDRVGLGRAMQVVVALAVVAPAAEAQGRPGRRGQGSPANNRAQMERQIQQRFDAGIRELLGLDDAQMEALGEVMQQFRRKRRELARRRERAQTRVRILGHEDLGGAPLTDESASAALAELIEISQAEAALFSEEQAGLLEVLSPVQVLQLQQLREDMGQRIQRLRGEGRGGRGGGGDLFEGFGF